MSDNKKLFLSAVRSEFLSYRELLSKDLKGPALDVAVQEDFIVTGGSTIEKLDDYICACDGIIHLIGKAAGAVPEEPAVAALLKRYPDFGKKLLPLAPFLSKPQPGFSYTQWEAYLALYHKRQLFIYLPTDFEREVVSVPRNARFVLNPAEVDAQKAHYKRISDLGRDRGEFLNEERLSSAVLRSLITSLPGLERTLTTTIVSPTKLRHSAERLIGRDEDLDRLDAAWNGGKNVVIIRAFGGMGKTSLVATWMAELAMKNWRGAERVFDWTFYSQGTSAERVASADSFIAAALTAFGDPDPTKGSPWDRGARLAGLVGKTRCLLVLDGLEPLQYPPGTMEGSLKDPGIEALLKGLCAHNAGLCVVTTREKIPDLQQHYGRTADDIELFALTDLAGAALLHHHGATRAGAHEIKLDDQELQAVSREVRGHGLTLQLLGKYLRLAEEGDIRRRHTVRLADADREYQNDATRPYGHAFKTMEAYEKWFLREGAQSRRQLAVLRLVGLFDRPASKGCLEALRRKPVITRLTESLVGLAPRDWTIVTRRLGEIDLLAVQADGSIDAHPLLREYFGERLRTTQPKAWRAAHRRLYQHLCATTKEGTQPTLEDLQPLYQAVAHGCQAGLQRETCDKVYRDRIQRGQAYATRTLGAVGADLGAVTCFFEQPWRRLSPSLTEPAQAWLFNEAAFSLAALGRLGEALEPMRAGLPPEFKRQDWKDAACGFRNLSQMELMLGEVARAVGDAEQSVAHAARSGDAFERVVNRATLADALHQAGRRTEADARFREAETMQAEREREHPLLYSLQGFQYCDLLLGTAERAAWARSAANTPVQRTNDQPFPNDGDNGVAAELQSCRAISQRTGQTLEWMPKHLNVPLTTALDHLTLGRAALYASILDPNNPQHSTANFHIFSAVDGLRRSGYKNHLPRGLLTRAWLRSLAGRAIGPDSAQSDLDEAWEIAERGPMPLFLADIHLYRARLFFRAKPYPWQSPQHDLAEARRLILKHGYLRRKEELEDAESALTSSIST
jgi:hypothetical protein